MIKKYYYKAIVSNVVDGDTFDMNVDLGFEISTKQRFRIKDFNAPESWRPKTEGEKKHGLEAKELAKVLLLNQLIMIETFKADLHGRYVVNVTLPDGRDFKTVMINSGMSKNEIYI